MVIPFSISFAFAPDSDPVVNAAVLKIMLENLIAVNRVYLQSTRKYGGSVPNLYRSGVTYGRTQTWDTIPDVMKKGYGDCKSLSAWLIAESREEGKIMDPVFRWIRNPYGVRDFHILVVTQQGFDDPSKKLGMNVRNQHIER